VLLLSRNLDAPRSGLARFLSSSESEVLCRSLEPDRRGLRMGRPSRSSLATVLLRLSRPLAFNPDLRVSGQGHRNEIFADTVDSKLARRAAVEIPEVLGVSQYLCRIDKRVRPANRPASCRASPSIVYSRIAGGG